MCGIAGFFYSSNITNNIENNIKSMLSSISHRGPDNEGYYIDKNNKLVLGHRRLSIIDLSSKGNQPMTSYRKNYLISFNGEIYNYINLRDNLKKEFSFNSWNSNSDTETILNYIEFYGIHKTLDDIDGMFCMAIWDKNKKKLYLARDAFGEKPLYYGWGENIFYFASELKALKKSIGFLNNINRTAISSLFELNYIANPYSIYEDIFKLRPGELIEVLPGCQNNIEKRNNFFKKIQWFSMEKVINNKQKQYSFADSKNLIENIVETRLISDAKLGCFLSGGIDSSLIASIISKISKNKYETFTIGFDENQYDESKKASKIAHHLGLKNNTLILDEKKMLDIIPDINNIYDEPFADSSQIPTFLLSQFASQFSKVALSGDGGDELFGGYNRYFYTTNIWNIASLFPYSLRNIFLKIAINTPVVFFNLIENTYNTFAPKNKKIYLLSDKIKKLSSKLLNSKEIESLYISFITEWNLNEILDNFPSLNYASLFKSKKISHLSFEENMMYFDSITYLPDDILTKVDRASMSVGLEVRAPLLSKNILALSYSMSKDQKIYDNKGKIFLKKMLSEYLPNELINYPKQGFGVPLSSWIKGPLKEWVYFNITSSKVRNQSYFDSNKIVKVFDQHCDGNVNLSNKLWPAIIFCDWYNRIYS